MQYNSIIQNCAIQGRGMPSHATRNLRDVNMAWKAGIKMKEQLYNLWSRNKILQKLFSKTPNIYSFQILPYTNNENHNLGHSAESR